jgi:HK97 family phage portal protein
VNIFGLEIRRATAPETRSYTTVNQTDGWYSIIREPYTGAWQRNDEWTTQSVVAHSAIYTCITLIASDIGKLRLRLVEQDANGIWSEIDVAAFSPVLRKPNHFQTRIQFYESWAMSKLQHGNTYVLLDRDDRGVVRGMYMLDPRRVAALIAPDGSVFYRLKKDELSGVEEDEVTVPSTDMIHDRMNCLFHPLIGTSPIMAAGMAAHIGLTIEKNNAALFGNDSSPPGILTAPGVIDQPTAEAMVARWHARDRGKIAVLGNGLAYTPLRVSAAESQMIEQLKWSAETVAACFHVPAFKIGAGQMPSNQNGELLNQIYYSDCLQSHLEQIELCLDEALGLPKLGYGVEFDIDSLLRMDQATQVRTLVEGLKGLYSPDEARAKIDLGPVPGGATPYLQQQNYSLAALDERDRNDPWGLNKPEPVPQPPKQEAEPEEEDTPPPARAAFELLIESEVLQLQAAI